MMRRWLLASVIAPTLLFSEVAWAEGRSRVVIQADVQSRDSGDVASRIAAELDNVGFEVVRITPGGAEDGAFATIVLSSKNGRVEAQIRVRNAGERDDAGARVDANDIEPAGARAAIAIRSVESLRATLFELTRDEQGAKALPEDVLRWARAMESAEPEKIEAPPTPPKAAAKESSSLVAAPVEPKKFLIANEPDKAAKPPEPQGASDDGRVWLGGGLSVLGSSAALGLSFGPRITFDYDLPYNFDIGASFSGAIPAHEVATNAYQLVLLGESSYTIGKRSWVVSPHVGAGAGIHIYEATEEVQAAPNTVPGIQRGIGFAVAPSVGAEFELADPVRLDVDFATIFVLPEPMISCCTGFVSEEGAKQPLFHATADLVFAP